MRSSSVHSVKVYWNTWFDLKLGRNVIEAGTQPGIMRDIYPFGCDACNGHGILNGELCKCTERVIGKLLLGESDVADLGRRRRRR